MMQNGKGRPRTWLTWQEIVDIRRMYKIFNKLDFTCRCGISGVENFTYHWEPKQRAYEFRCHNCNTLQRIKESHEDYAKALDDYVLTREFTLPE